MPTPAKSGKRIFFETNLTLLNPAKSSCLDVNQMLE